MLDFIELLFDQAQASMSVYIEKYVDLEYSLHSSVSITVTSPSYERIDGYRWRKYINPGQHNDNVQAGAKTTP